ncbi:MAG: hypothetical protein NVS2B7_17580 [Herpetosiphon sp.]
MSGEQYIHFKIDDEPFGGLRVGGKAPARLRVVNGLRRNNARAAYGFWWYGQRHQKLEFVEAASAIVRWTLAAPRVNGLFAVVYDKEHETWERSCRAQDHFDVAACAWTARWLVRYYDDLEHESAILELVRDLGERLITEQRSDGSVPSMVLSDRPRPSGDDDQTTAISALFLAELGQLTGDREVAAAAVRATRSVAHRIGTVWGSADSFSRVIASLAALRVFRLAGGVEMMQYGFTAAEVAGEALAVAGDDDWKAGLWAELGGMAYRLGHDQRFVAPQTRGLLMPVQVGLHAANWTLADRLAATAALEINYPDVLELFRL